MILLLSPSASMMLKLLQDITDRPRVMALYLPNAEEEAKCLLKSVIYEGISTSNYANSFDIISAEHTLSFTCQIQISTRFLFSVAQAATKGQPSNDGNNGQYR